MQRRLTDWETNATKWKTYTRMRSDYTICKNREKRFHQETNEWEWCVVLTTGNASEFECLIMYTYDAASNGRRKHSVWFVFCFFKSFVLSAVDQLCRWKRGTAIRTYIRINELTGSMPRCWWERWYKPKQVEQVAVDFFFRESVLEERLKQSSNHNNKNPYGGQTAEMVGEIGVGMGTWIKLARKTGEVSVNWLWHVFLSFLFGLKISEVDLSRYFIY